MNNERMNPDPLIMKVIMLADLHGFKRGEIVEGIQCPTRKVVFTTYNRSGVLMNFSLGTDCERFIGRETVGTVAAELLLEQAQGETAILKNLLDYVQSMHRTLIEIQILMRDNQ